MKEEIIELRITKE